MSRIYKTRRFFLAVLTGFTLAASAVYADQNTAYSTSLSNGVSNAVGTEFSRSFNSAPQSYGAAYYDYPPPVNTTYVPNYVAPPAPVPPPSPIYTDGTSGSYCRQYSESVHIGSRVDEAYGTACLQPDGTWRVVQ